MAGADEIEANDRGDMVSGGAPYESWDPFARLRAHCGWSVPTSRSVARGPGKL